MSIIIFFVVLVALITFHELGHFIVAKLSGIRVDEFGLGLPPRIWGTMWRGTLYSINYLPFGGFVKIYGEDSSGLNLPDASDSFVAKNKLTQSAVVLAGIFFNLVLAFFAVWLAISIGVPMPTNMLPNHIDLYTNKQVIITAVVPGSSAKEAGVVAGSKVVSISSPSEQVVVTDSDDIINFAKRYPNVALELKTDGSTYSVTPSPYIGIELDTVGDIKLPVLDALIVTPRVSYYLFIGTMHGLKSFIVGLFSGMGLSGVVGPIGIASLVGEASSVGFGNLLVLVAALSMSLAVINLVPFPALDGGRFAIICIEGIIRRPINSKVVNYINSIGFALLILLMLVISYRDIANLL